MFCFPPSFNVGDTIYFPFDTFDSNGGSITITGLAVTDIEVYKNGSVTQRSSDNGYALLDTDGIDFDGSVGLHGFSIDTSDNSDAGFWVDGAQYWVHINAITVDSQTVRFTYFLPLGYLLRPTTAGRTLDIQSTGEADVNLTMMGGATQSATDLKDFADAGYNPLSNSVTQVDNLAVSAKTDVSEAVWDVTQATHAGAGTFGEIATEIADILADTAEIGTAGVGLTNLGGSANNWSTHAATAIVSGGAITTSGGAVSTVTDVTNDVGVNEWGGVLLATTNPLPNAAAGAAGGLPTDSTGKTSFNDLSAAQVNTEVDNSMITYGLDHLISSALPTSWAVDVAANSVFDQLADDGTAAYDRTTDSLQAQRDNHPTNFSDMTIEVTTGIVDGNIEKINNVQIVGDGSATPFGV